MKKAISFLLCLMFLISALAGCGTAEKSSDKKLKIVTTVFPVYDWVSHIVGDGTDTEITMLLDSGVDLHSFQPTAEDIINISSCDLFVYVGGESDVWTEDALKNPSNQNRKTLNLMDALGDRVKTEEVKEGMQAEKEENGEEEEPETDEHIWLSLKNAEFCVQAIEAALNEVNPSSAAQYAQNRSDYSAKLTELDDRYTRTVENAKKKTLLFGDRFPFRYLTEDYGLDYFAAFVGCSAESEASFETVSFLARKTDELGLRYIMALEGSEHALAQTIIKNTAKGDQKILVMDSMQSVTADNVKNGADYLAAMEKNLTVLTTALQ